MTKQNKAKGLDNFRDAGASSAPGSIAALPIKNPVAKFAHRFNKAQVFADKRHYQRKAKHKGQEPFSIVSDEMIEKGSRQPLPALPYLLHPRSRRLLPI